MPFAQPYGWYVLWMKYWGIQGTKSAAWNSLLGPQAFLLPVWLSKYGLAPAGTEHWFKHSDRMIQCKSIPSAC